MISPQATRSSVLEAGHAPIRFIQAAGARVAYREWGAGQPVLCLHATGHDSRDFEAFAVRVGAGFRIIAIDWPGQGQSPSDGGPPRAQHYAKLAEAVCDALALKKPILLGNSIGGAAALIAAAASPTRYRALVLCNPGGLAPLDAVSRFAIGRMVAFFEAGARGATWFPAAFRAYYRHLVLPRAPARDRREAIIAQGPALAPLLAEAWRDFAEDDADLRARAQGLTLPVWCAWARNDHLVSWERSKAAVKTIPNVSVKLFRGGHAAFLEDPDRFAKAFQAFVGRVRTDDMR